ncbi:MAG: PH domain-containing protein [Firmicutes bacterium]|nr:PH domain-containing protein [Bacillota bacterium]
MSKLSDNLQKNEEVIAEAKTHWSILIGPVIAAFLVLAIFSDYPVVWLIIDAIILIPPVIKLLTTELSLSNKRLVGKVGLVNTRQMDSPLDKVTSVTVESGLLGKILGYAKISVNTASTVYNYMGIKDADFFRQQVMESIEKANEEKQAEQARKIAMAMNGTQPI